MKRILVCGLATVDFLFEVHAMPDSAEKYTAEQASMVGGGGAANAAVAISRLGGHSILAARVGDDLFGQIIVDELKADAVDCSLVQRVEGGQSSYSSVLVDRHGERQIVNFRGAGLPDHAQMIDGVTIDAVLADTRWQAGTVAALTRARQLGVPGVLDAEAPVLPDALALASHIAFSRQGLRDYTGNTGLHSGLEQASNTLDGWVCVTDGGDGVFYLRDGKIVNVPVAKVTVVDTLGAGDVWHGAFALALCEGFTEHNAITFANGAATLKCTRSGGGRGGPTREELRAFTDKVLPTDASLNQRES